MAEPTNSIQRRVEKTVARVFDVPPSEAASLGLGLHPRWDSMAHMELVMEIEKEFGLRFPTYEIGELLNPAAITKAVERYIEK